MRLVVLHHQSGWPKPVGLAESAMAARRQNDRPKRAADQEENCPQAHPIWHLRSLKTKADTSIQKSIPRPSVPDR